MNCGDCSNLLETYVDGEAGEHEAESVRTHLMTCTSCEAEFEALTAETELYARYDRELQITPAAWTGIAARIAAEAPVVPSPARREVRGWFAGLFAIPRFGFAFSGALAVLLVMVAFGYFYLRTESTTPRLQLAGVNNVRPGTSRIIPTGAEQTAPTTEPVNAGNPGSVAVAENKPAKKHNAPLYDDPGVLFTDVAYNSMEDKDTATHLDQAQKLLVSFRTLQSDDDQEVDVSYEKAESRRLLNENVVLRRDAEATGKFPTKSVLGSLEPFLIDIANLPDKAAASDVRQIKDRVQRTEIVAELRSY